MAYISSSKQGNVTLRFTRLSNLKVLYKAILMVHCFDNLHPHGLRVATSQALGLYTHSTDIIYFEKIFFPSTKDNYVS